MSEFVSATADIRGEYRYSLSRVWDPTLPNITFVLLNPSTADADQLDPTLRRCVKFAKREGFGGMVILNLYAFRTKHPHVMLAADDPVGPDNDRILASATGTIVAGWGANAAPARVAEALALLPRLHVLGMTKDGYPRHPLYVRASAPLFEWAPSTPSDHAEDRAAVIEDSALPESVSDAPAYARIEVRSDASGRPRTDRIERDFDLLTDAILDELQVINAFLEFGIPERAIATLASAVTSRVDSAFEVRWSPNWVPHGRPHVWQESDGWHARCNECLAESPVAATEADSVAWFDAHWLETHAH